MTERVKCTECENMILPDTAADNGGLCAQCIKISPEARAEQRRFEQQLADGTYFHPSDTELKSESLPSVLTNGHDWRLQPEFYSEQLDKTPIDILNEMPATNEGNIFLVTDDGDQLNVGYSEKFAVCEYQNESTGEFRIAYSDANLTEQVDDNLHVDQACPCCGVSMLWYPSRYHMPRTLAFEIVRDTINRKLTPNIRWLETDDYTHTFRGRG